MIWRFITLAASIAIVATTIGGAEAQTLKSGIIDDVKAAVLAAEAAAAPEARLQSYDAAQEALLFVQRLSAEPYADPAAQEALAKLEADGITNDRIALASVETVAKLLAGASSSDESTRLRARIYEMIGTIKVPIFRARSYMALASIEKDDTALAYLQDALVAARVSEEGADRSDVLSQIVGQASAIPQGKGDKIVDLAVSAISDVRSRATARRIAAVSMLADTRYATSGANELARASARLLSEDFRSALLTALAIPLEASKQRRDALNAVLDAAVVKGDQQTLLTLSTAYAGDEEQGNAIVRMVQSAISSGRLLNALPLLNAMPPGEKRLSSEMQVAVALKDVQYGIVAMQLYERGLADLSSVAVDERPSSIAAVIAASAAMGRFDDTINYFKQLSSYADVGDVLANAVVALAQVGRTSDAQSIVSVIADPGVAARAKASIAVARLASGEDVTSILSELTAGESRATVLAAIAKDRAAKGDIAGVVATVKDIELPAAAVDSLLGALRVFRTAGNRPAVVQIGEEVATRIAALDQHLRETAIGQLAGDFVWAGQEERAKELFKSVDGSEQRARAMAAMAVSYSEQNNAADAFALVKSLPPVKDHDALAAEVFISISKNQAWLRRVTDEVSAFEDEMLRVRTFRRIAEEQLHALDVYGLGTGKGTSHDRSETGMAAVKVVPASTSGEAPIPIFATTTEQLAKVSSRPTALGTYTYPDLQFGVADIRSALPDPTPGKVSVTLAHLSPYNEKFLEDLAGGNNGISYASEAQKELYPRIIVVQSGVYTLGSLAEELAGEGDLVVRDGDAIILRAPILVSAGATLILSGQEAATYRLSATQGSFIAVAGSLYIVDTHVMSWDEATLSARHSDVNTSGTFRPYIVGWSGANLMIGGSFLDSLGYAAPKSFGLAFSAGPTAVLDSQRELPAPKGHVVDNSFHNFEYGFYSYEAQDVFLVGNEYTDNVIYAVDPHDRSKRLVIALNTTYGTHKKHGIITSREVDGSWIVGNVSFGNHGSGFMLDRDSTDTMLYGNVAFDNEQDGLTLFESSCNLVAGNHFFDNGRAGIKVRNSWDVAIFDNKVIGNTQSAIEAYTSRIEDTSKGRNFVEDPYTPLTTFSAGNNVISNNRDGIKVRGVAGFSLFGQDFSGQAAPLLAGDARAFEGHILRFNKDAGILIRSTACLEPRPSNLCSFRLSGIFDGDSLDLAYGVPRADCAQPTQAVAE